MDLCGGEMKAIYRRNFLFFFVIYFSPTGSGLKLLSKTLLGRVSAASTCSRSPFIHQPVAFGRLEAAAPLEP